MSTLTIVGGPMFAGKTTWLLNYAKKLSPGSFQLFKPNIDVRFSVDKCVTHDGDSLPAINLHSGNPVFPKLHEQIRTILIDELNFFSKDALHQQVQNIQKEGKDVVGVGLLYDSEKQPFGATLEMSRTAHTFIQLYARCDRCGKRAQHSYRKIQSTQQVILGAKEMYGACCSLCWEVLHLGKRMEGKK